MTIIIIEQRHATIGQRLWLNWRPHIVNLLRPKYYKIFQDQKKKKKKKRQTQCQRHPHEWGLGKGITEAKSYPCRNSAERRLRTQNLVTRRASTHQLHQACPSFQDQKKKRKKKLGTKDMRKKTRYQRHDSDKDICTILNTNWETKVLLHCGIVNCAEPNQWSRSSNRKITSILD
jgi:hypothetical protein